jgi:hypothetical protein
VLGAAPRGLVLGIGLLVASGCYTYVPLRAPQPRTGVRIAAELTDSGTAGLSAYLGRGATTVDGRVLSAENGVVELSVVSVRTRDGQPSYWSGETVSLPRSMIAGMKERRLAKGSTVLIGGAITAFVLIAVDAFSGGLFGSDDGGPPPPPL